MHAPVGGKEHVDVGFGEELGRGVGAEENTDLPGFRKAGDEVFRQSDRFIQGYVGLAEMEDVPSTEGSSGGSAEASKEEGAAGAEVRLGVDAAAKGKVGSNSFFRGGAEGEDVAGFGLDGGVARNGLAG